MPAAFSAFTLGDFEVTVLSDGHHVVPIPQRSSHHTREEVAAIVLEHNYLAVSTDCSSLPLAARRLVHNPTSDLVLFEPANERALDAKALRPHAPRQLQRAVTVLYPDQRNP